MSATSKVANPYLSVAGAVAVVGIAMVGTAGVATVALPAVASHLSTWPRVNIGLCLGPMLFLVDFIGIGVVSLRGCCACRRRLRRGLCRFRLWIFV